MILCMGQGLKRTVLFALAIIISISLSLAFLFANSNPYEDRYFPESTQPLPEAMVYLGVTYCGNNVTEAKLLIDKVKGYTNLFVIQSGSLQTNVSAINRICSYAIESGLHIIVYFSAVPTYRQHIGSFLSTADAWGSNLLGIYFDDEPGGKMLDSQYSMYFYDNNTNSIIEKSPRSIIVTQNDGSRIIYAQDGAVTTRGIEEGMDVFYQPNETIPYEERNSAKYIVKPNGTVYIRSSESNIISEVIDSDILAKIETYPQVMDKKPFQTYDETARIYISTIQNSTGWLHDQTKVRAFTSDYALYWFNYKGGFDVVFAELGWNHTTTQDIALVRGAANAEGKDWGAIVTWKYSYPERVIFPSGEYGPYLASGNEIYSQLRMAYEAGAKYLVVFNYPTYPAKNTYGILQPEHFEALERLWTDTINNQTVIQGNLEAKTALVLPSSFGGGMRNPQDNIWGLWQADENSAQIWIILQECITRYGLQLDIVYDNPRFSDKAIYSRVIWWNQTS